MKSFAVNDWPSIIDRLKFMCIYPTIVVGDGQNGQVLISFNTKKKVTPLEPTAAPISQQVLFIPAEVIDLPHITHLVERRILNCVEIPNTDKNLTWLQNNIDTFDMWFETSGDRIKLI